MRKTIIILAALVAAPAGAQDLPEAHRNIIKHFGEASVIAERCPIYKLNGPIIRASLVAHRVPDGVFNGDGPYAREMKRVMLETAAGLAAHEEIVVCATGRALYGDSGQNVPKLLVER